MTCTNPDQVKRATLLARVPLTGDFAADFIFKAELCSKAELYVDGHSCSWTHAEKDYDREISCTEISTSKPFVSFAEFRQTPSSFVNPEISEISEQVRSANLGLVGWLLGLKHTALAFRTSTGEEVLLEKTADVGVWFRKRGFFETSKSNGSAATGEIRDFKTIYEKISSSADFKEKMKSSSTCQHFTRDCMHAFSAKTRTLHNQWVFDKVGGWFRDDAESRHSEIWLRYVKSTGLQTRLHEKLCSWRHRLFLRRVD